MQKSKATKLFRDINFQKDSLGSLIVKLAFPAMGIMLLNGLFNLVELLVIGNGISTKALAAMGIVYPVQLLILSVGLALGLGAATLSHRAVHSKDEAQARRVLGNTFSLALLVSVIVMVLGLIYQNYILEALGVIPDLIPWAREYLVSMFLGSPIIIVSSAMAHLVRAEGKPNLSLGIIFIASVINLGLTPIFVLIFNWGMIGVALASIISYFVASIILLVYFAGNKSLYKLKFSDFDLNPKLITLSLRAALPSLLKNASVIITIMIVNYFIKAYIPAFTRFAFAGFAISYRLVLMVIIMLSGYIKALQPIVSFNISSNNYGRVREIIKVSNIVSVFLVIPFFLVFYLASNEILSLFMTEANAVSFATDILKPMALVLPISGLYLVTTMFFQSIGKAVSNLLLGLVSFTFLLLVWGFDSFSIVKIAEISDDPVRIVYYLIPVSQILLTLVAVFWQNTEMKRLRVFENQTSLEQQAMRKIKSNGKGQLSGPTANKSLLGVKNES
jgi:putative MATE family efflux protein